MSDSKDLLRSVADADRGAWQAKECSNCGSTAIREDMCMLCGEGSLEYPAAKPHKSR